MGCLTSLITDRKCSCACDLSRYGCALSTGTVVWPPLPKAASRWGFLPPSRWALRLVFVPPIDTTFSCMFRWLCLRWRMFATAEGVGLCRTDIGRWEATFQRAVDRCMRAAVRAVVCSDCVSFSAKHSSRNRHHAFQEMVIHM